MGQSWTVALTWKKEHKSLYGGYDVDMVETFFAHDYIYEWEHEDGSVSKHINGYKLMETSYIGNQMVKDVVSELVAHRNDHPRITWIGEYALDGKLPGRDEGALEELGQLVRVVDGPFEHSIRHEAVQDAQPPKVWILCPELGQYVRYDPGEGGIAAIAILCAVGNGLGGGDYHGTNMDMVGTWAYRELEVRDEEPEGQDLTEVFKEKEEE